MYTQATDLLRTQLAPASQDLTNRNAAILQSTYVTDRSQAITARNWVFLIGVVVLVAVIAPAGAGSSATLAGSAMAEAAPNFLLSPPPFLAPPTASPTPAISSLTSDG